MISCIRHQQIVKIVKNTPDMIRVGMGENHICNCTNINASSVKCGR